MMTNNLKRNLLTLRYHLLSRHGKIILAIATVCSAILWINRSAEEVEEGGLSSSSEGVSGKATSNDLEAPIQSASENESFEFFDPVKPEAEETKRGTTAKIPAEPIPLERPPSTPLVIEAPEVFEPLIKEERQAARIMKPQLESHSHHLPPLEQGATIHCQLLFPATSHQPNSPVIAQVTQPLVRDGITIIAAGSKVFGKVQSTKGKRLFFSTDWSALNSVGEQISLTANAMQKGGGASDGQIGMPGLIENEAPPQNLAKLLTRSVIRGVAEIGKDTIRTGAGDYIPASGRNSAISGGSAISDELLTPKVTTVVEVPYVNVPAGNEFYLVVSSQKKINKPSPAAGSSSDTLDRLLEQMMKKRLEQ